MLYTVVYYDDDAQKMKRVVQDWPEKIYAQDYAKDLRRIYGRVRVLPVDKCKDIGFSVS